MSFGKRWDSTWKGFYTINSRAQVPSIFSEHCLSQAKRMIALPWQNINRVKISQWFRELYSCLRLEKITHALKGRDDSKRVRFIYIKHMDESFSGLLWPDAFSSWTVLLIFLVLLYSNHQALGATSCSQILISQRTKDFVSSVPLCHIISHNLTLAYASTWAFSSKYEAVFTGILLSTLYKHPTLYIGSKWGEIKHKELVNYKHTHNTRLQF